MKKNIIITAKNNKATLLLEILAEIKNATITEINHNWEKQEFKIALKCTIDDYEKIRHYIMNN